MIERKIKELSIALEALSRINSQQAAQAFEAIEGLLSRAISDAHKEYYPPQTFTPSQLNDDGIPF